MTGARMIMQVLADEGVTTIFGYSGGAILPTYDAVFLYNEAGQAGRRPADPADRARQRAGRRIHGRRLRPRQRPGGRVHRDLGPGRDQHCYTRARLHGRFDTDCRDLRPGAPCRHRHRCLPGGAHRPRSWGPSPSTSSWSPIRRSSRPRCAPPSRSRAPGAPGRWSSTSRRTCRTGKATFAGEGLLPIPGYRRRMRELSEAALEPGAAARFFAHARRSRSGR